MYDNLAGTICSLDVIPNGTSSYTSANNENGDARNGKNNNNNNYNNNSYDGLLLGFSGHPRLSVVYPSTPMVGGGGSSSSSSCCYAGTQSGMGQGGVLLASSIIDLTSALMERSMGGTSFLEQDIIVTVLAKDEEKESSMENVMEEEEDDPPCVSVVLGGGVAIASFFLPKGPRPCEGGDSSSSSLWWRVASEPYVLPLSLLSAKTRELGCSGSSTNFPGINGAAAAPPTTTATNIMSGRGSTSRTNQDTAVGLGPSVSHGMGDIIDVTFLSGYTEPTLLVLHSNPKRGGGRAWSGRLGRTAEVPVTSTTNALISTAEDEYGDDSMESMNGGNKSSSRVETILMPTGTKYGLTLTAISLALHQHRSVVLWSLIDALPADAWKLIPHPTTVNVDGGVLVWGVNTIVYVSMGGKIKCALAANGFAKVGCPPGLLPPPLPSSRTSRGGLSGGTAGHLEANPSPLPSLALQLDGASRVSFVTDNVALVCLGNGTLHLLELHNYSSTSKMSMFMSLFPLGHKVGGLGSVVSCLSVFQANTAFHTKCVSRYLGEEEEDNHNKREESIVSSALIKKPSPKIQARGLIFVGSRMGDCTLLAFSMNEPIRLIATSDIDIGEEGADKSVGILKSDVIPNFQSSMSAGGFGSGEPMRKQPRIEKKQIAKILDDEVGDSYDSDSSQVHGHTDQSEASVVIIGSSIEPTRDEILRREEEELYRMEDINDGAAPSIISSYNDENEEVNEFGNTDDDDDDVGPTKTRRSVCYISMFQSIRALDSLTGLGPLGGG